MNSDQIRDEVYGESSDNDTESSTISILRNLSDSDDPSVHISDLDYGSDSDVVDPNLSDMDIDIDIGVDLDPPNLGNVQPIQNPEDSRDQEQVDSDQEEIQVGLNEDESIIWHKVEGNLNEFDFTPLRSPGVTEEAKEKLNSNIPFEFFSLFLDDDILDLLVNETNKYAEQCIIDAIVNEQKKVNLEKWFDVTREEMLIFVGLLLWMGLDQKPKLRNYWSKDAIYSSKLSKCMSRNRFESILTCIHVADNNALQENDRLGKVRPLVDSLNEKFQTTLTPNEQLCIDESMILFRGRVKFRQYIPSKRHRYGIKLFKLCVKGGYTWNMKIYAGKQTRPTQQKQPVSASTVMDLTEPLLERGHTMYTDNFYTSVKLAHLLMKKKTHLVGTLRKKRKLNSKSVETKQLTKGQMTMKESNTGVIMGKWKHQRDVLFLTTRSTPRMVEVTTRRGTVKKPSTILEYNDAKSYIDVSDQLASYGNVLRRGVKWNRKVIFELLTNTCVVNAHFVYKSTVLSPKGVVEFREMLVKHLLTDRLEDTLIEEPSSQHKLVNGANAKRGRCTSCYQILSARQGRKEASRKSAQVNSNCIGCPDKYMCLECFFKKHRSTLRK